MVGLYKYTLLVTFREGEAGGFQNVRIHKGERLLSLKKKKKRERESKHERNLDKH